MPIALDLARARAAGVRAAREGAARSSSPYRPDAEQPREAMLWRAWHAGYDSVRPLPIDYTG